MRGRASVCAGAGFPNDAAAEPLRFQFREADGGAPMTNISVAAPATSGEFRIGRVFSQAATVLSRNFLGFFAVTFVAALPRLLWITAFTSPAAAVGRVSLGLFLTLVLNMLGQAIVVYAAFQDMRNKPVNIGESLKVGLRRLLSIIGIAVCIGFALIAVFAAPAVTASLLLYGRSLVYVALAVGVAIGIVLAALLLTMWLVATPACVVAQKGPLASMGRSSNLTKGHRWKIFGMILLLFVVGALIGGIVGGLLGLTRSFVLVTIGTLVWTGAWGAFYATIVVVTYHDLRVAKEGIDIHQIASVFD
jgi:MFS family permease